MKTPHKIQKLGALAVLIALSAILFSCKTTPSTPVRPVFVTGKPNPAFIEGHVVVPRVLNILKPRDLEGLNRTLGEYDKTLYQVAFYKAGKPVREEGELRCVTAQELLIVNAAALKSGASDVAIQIGAKTKKKPTPTPTPEPKPAGVSCYTQEDQEEAAAALVKKVTPILRAYASR